MTRALAAAAALALALTPSLGRAQNFRRPVACSDCIRNWYYFDHGGGTDWACNGSTYDGHRGTDFSLAGGNGAISRGNAVVAAADGVVLRTHDGDFDRCTACGAPGCGLNNGNYVVVVHGDRHVMYWHLRLGSVRVSPGQAVSCGQVLGEIGSSGCSSGAHLHFEVRALGGRSSTAVDPFQGGCSGGPSLWRDQGAWRAMPGDACQPSCSPSPEVCDNADNDCDGRVDDFSSGPCGSSVGTCRPGTRRCAGGAWSCVDAVEPAAERCDGLDNNCDGVDDEIDEVCGSSVGTCRPGTRRCRAAQWGACVGNIDPVPERCDGLDNDCDGVVDSGQVCEREAYAVVADTEGGSTDVNGDGRADACMRTPAGFRCLLAGPHGFGAVFLGPSLTDLPPGAESTVRLGDLDGDGRADLCAREGDHLRCWRATAAGFGDGFDGPRVPDGLVRTALVDIDGDRRDDLCLLARAGLACHRSTGAGFDRVATLPALADLADDVHRWGSLRFGDLDGDGRADLCARTRDGVRCWRSEGAGFGAGFAGPAWRDDEGFDALSRAATVRLADVTGDGRADLCARTLQGFVCHPSEGRGFGPALAGPALPRDEGWDRQDAFTTLRFGDLNADGRQDLCGRALGRLRCWIAGPHGFDRALEGPALLDAEGWNRSARYTSLRLADLTGDGRADVASRGADGLRFDATSNVGFELRWRAGAWGAELDDPAWADTLRIAGGGRIPPPLTDPGCACRADHPRSRGAAGVYALALALLGWRRRRRGASREGSTATGSPSPRGLRRGSARAATRPLARRRGRRSPSG